MFPQSPLSVGSLPFPPLLVGCSGWPGSGVTITPGTGYCQWLEVSSGLGGRGRLVALGECGGCLSLGCAWGEAFFPKSSCEGLTCGCLPSMLPNRQAAIVP